jgi:hypothetical protein
MANLANFGVPGAGAGILHPRLRHKFRVTFTGLGNLVPGTNSRNLTMQVVTVGLPSIKWNMVEVKRYNSTSYIAGKHEWDPIDLTVEDDVSGLAATVVKAQLETQQRIVGSDLNGRWLNTAATGSDYKFSMKIDQLDGDETVLQYWILEGVQITDAKFGDRDYTDNGTAATIDMSLRFDHARHVESGLTLGTALGGQVA